VNRTEYIGKLNALYVGEKNCLEELITAYDEKGKEIERLNKALLDIKELVVNNACLDESINKCVDDLIYYKCDELLDIVNKALGSEKKWVKKDYKK